MRSVKVSEAEGSVLNWMVAKCKGISPIIRPYNTQPGAALYAHGGATIPLDFVNDWAQGGPIIEREGIELRPNKFGATGWTAWTLDRATKTQARNVGKSASSPLIAAMRCYVASKLGDEVEVPEELCEE